MSELLDSIQPYLTKWYVVISALLVSFFIAHKISVARFKATHNCAASPEYYKVNWFSLPLLYRLIQVKREGRLLDFAQKIYDDVKALTFVIKIMILPWEPDTLTLSLCWEMVSSLLMVMDGNNQDQC